MENEKVILVELTYITSTHKFGGTVYKKFAVRDLETLLKTVRKEFIKYNGSILTMEDLRNIEELGVIQLRPRLKPITIGEMKIKEMFLDFFEIDVINQVAEG